MVEDIVDPVEEGAEEAESEAEDNFDEEQSSSEDLKIPQVEEAKKTVADFKAENEKREKLIEREEKLLARKEALNALGGDSNAGSKPNAPKELTPAEYKAAIERGEIPK